ncbi:MAG: IS630 family transposase [Chloroflexi bacterium]|nr:IS630 family transposase [Chloroflexota bacterium]MBV9543276.1 IS630 family transposase [Chloroflexota bacterium]
MKKLYRVKLTAEERMHLQELLSKGKAAARTLTHARILLKTDEGVDGPRLTDEEIAEALDVNRSTVERVRIRCVEEGFDAALRPRPSRQLHPRKLDGVQEAHLVTLACSPAPKGRGKWSLRLLADKLVELQIVDDVSYETVRQTLKKNELKPWLKQQYCLPEAPSGEFVYHMEDVLDVYMRAYDPRRPQVCLDETSIQLLREKRTPVPTAPGRPARFDYEYERNGVCALFMLNEPIRGWREVVVGDQRTAVDFAHVIKHLVDVHYVDAEKIVLVMDNLNTHTPGSLYEAFEPTEARRLIDKLEIHYTPKHGSWLNMAETELSVLTTQCLDRRIPNKPTLVEEVTAWMHERNVYERAIDWRFTTPDARIKLKRLYPAILP